MGTPLHRAMSPWVWVSILVGVMPLFWLGDVSFILDEPLLITKALQANAAGVLETVGLRGTRGIDYGPLPTWMYQALLMVTHNLVNVALLRCLGSMIVVVAALLWLSRSLSLSQAFVPVILLSPYLWHYDRVLWDNTLLLPLSALCLASAVAVQKRSLEGLSTTWPLVLCMACGLAMPLVHLMSAAIVAPVALHLLVTQPRAVKRAWLPILGVLIAFVLISRPYFSVAFSNRSADEGHSFQFQSLVFAIQGGRYFSAAGLDYFYHDGWASRFLFPGAFVLTIISGTIAHALFAGGLAVSLHAGTRRGALENPQRLRRTTAWLLVGIVLAQTLLNTATGTNQHPHYYNATWIAGAVLSWLVADRLLAALAGRVLLVLHSAILVVCIAGIAWQTHSHHGDQHDHGPTLANQMAVANEVTRLAPRELRIENGYQQWRPHGLNACLAAAGYKATANGPVVAVRSLSADPEMGELEVVKVADRQ